MRSVLGLSDTASCKPSGYDDPCAWELGYEKDPSFDFRVPQCFLRASGVTYPRLAIDHVLEARLRTFFRLRRNFSDERSIRLLERGVVTTRRAIGVDVTILQSIIVRRDDRLVPPNIA